MTSSQFLYRENHLVSLYPCSSVLCTEILFVVCQFGVFNRFNSAVAATIEPTPLGGYASALYLKKIGRWESMMPDGVENMAIVIDKDG